MNNLSSKFILFTSLDFIIHIHDALIDIGVLETLTEFQELSLQIGHEKWESVLHLLLELENLVCI